MIPKLDSKNPKNESDINEESSHSTTQNKKLKDDPYLKFKEKARDSTKSSLNAAIIASKNINENIRTNIEKAKDSQSYHDLQEKLSQLEKTVNIKQVEFRKNSPRVFYKIKHGFLSGFEQFVGRIRIGTQYGKSSIDLLSDLAKLKELGIISDDEFNSKKKEILGRI